MTKKEYLYKKTTQIPIYEYDLMIIISNSPEKVTKLTNIEFDEIFATAVQYPYKNKVTHFVVLNVENINQLTYGIIAHESLHIVNMIFNQIGMKHDINNDETAAYLIEWIYNQIIRFINEKKMINKLKI